MKGRWRGSGRWAISSCAGGSKQESLTALRPSDFSLFEFPSECEPFTLDEAIPAWPRNRAYAASSKISRRVATRMHQPEIIRFIPAPPQPIPPPAESAPTELPSPALPWSPSEFPTTAARFHQHQRHHHHQHPVTAASSRLLKISRPVTLVAGPAARRPRLR